MFPGGSPPPDNRVVIEMPVYISRSVLFVMVALAVCGIILSLAALWFNFAYRKTKYELRATDDNLFLLLILRNIKMSWLVGVKLKYTNVKTTANNLNRLTLCSTILLARTSSCLNKANIRSLRYDSEQSSFT